MRTLSIWRHALLALSLLTLSSTALASAPSARPQKPEQSSTLQSQGKHVKRKTATVRDTQASASDRVRRASKPTTRNTAHKTRSAAKAKTSSAATAHTKTAPKTRGRTAKRGEPAKKPAAQPPKLCLHDPVTIVRGADNHAQSMVLTRCNGRPADGALQRFSNFLVPSLAASQPRTPATTGAKAAGPNAIKTLDVGLMNRVQAIATRFSGHPVRIASSLRPMSARSYHQSGRAVDMLVTGVSNEDLVAFCRTLPDTGCGYYPNSTFVHVDVRSPGTGHVYWIDASRPGEPARYVTSWPEKIDRAQESSGPPAGLTHDDHPPADSAPEQVPAADDKSAPPKQPLTGDLELDSKQDEKKAR